MARGRRGDRESHEGSSRLTSPQFAKELRSKGLGRLPSGNRRGRGNRGGMFDLRAKSFLPEKTREEEKARYYTSHVQQLKRDIAHLNDQKRKLGNELVEREQSHTAQLQNQGATIRGLEIDRNNVLKELEILKVHYQKLEQERNNAIAELDTLRTRCQELWEQLRLVYPAIPQPAMPVGYQPVIPQIMENREWVSKPDREIHNNFVELEAAFAAWAKEYAVPFLNDVDQIPQCEKNKVIELLNGYCVQYDWNVLVNHCPEPVRSRLPSLLVQAMVAKSAFETFFENPFFFLLGRRGSGIEAGSILMQLYTVFMKRVDRVQAHVWRSDTLRLLNTRRAPFLDTEDSVPQQAKKIREALAERVTDRFLSGPVKYLSRENLSYFAVSQRRQDLLKIFTVAAELANSLWTQRSHIKCYGLKDLQKCRIGSPEMEPHVMHHSDDRLDTLNQRPVLVVIQPAIVAYGSDDEEGYNRGKVWKQAAVVLGQG